MSKKPIALIIMDGFGYNHKDYGNAIRAAKTPNIDRLLANYPHTLIGASGMDVGLPEGQMGNSEVGHTNIGAGRIVYQELTRITKSIKDGEFFSNEAFTAAVENCKKNDSALHLFGTAAFIHIIHTSMVFWSLLRKQVLQRYTFIALWTAEMFLLQAVLTLLLSLKKSSRKLASAR